LTAAESTQDCSSAASDRKLPGILWLVIGVVFLLIPALFLQFYLDAYLAEQQQESLDFILEKTHAELALLQRELNQKVVVGEAIVLIQKRLRELPELKQQNAYAFAKLESVISRTFPKSAKLIWLSHNGDFLASNDAEFAGGRRSWESLASVLQGSKSDSKRRIADNLVKFAISRHLNADFFRQATAEPIEIFYRGKRYYLCRLELSSSKIGKCGTLFAFLPLFKRKAFWLEQRAIRKFAGKGLQIGIYQTDLQECVEPSTLSSNLLVGFLAEFAKGSNTLIRDGYTYCFSYLPTRKDFFICVGSAHLQSLNSLKNRVLFLKLLALVPFLLCVLFAILLSSRLSTQSILSLQARFKLTTLALSLVPIIIMAILGSINSSLIGNEAGRQRVEKLRNQINTVKDQTLQNMTSFATSLSADIDQFTSNAQLSELIASRISGKYASVGCRSVFLVTKSADIHYAKTIAELNKSAQIRLLLGLLEWELRFHGFAFDAMRDKYGGTIISSSWGNISRSVKYDRFIEFELGSNKILFFSRLLRNQSREVTGMAILAFDKTEFYHHLFLKAFKEKTFADTRLFAKSLRKQLPLPFPASSSVKEILELTAFAGKEFIRRLTYRGKNYLILGRPFESLNLAMVGVTRLGNDSVDLQAMFLLSLAGTILLAAFAARYSFLTMNTRLLLPLERLSSAVEDVRSGVLGKTIKCDGCDELAELAGCFNKMSLGLKEKSAMARFLNRDLITGDSLHSSSQIRRITAVVLFVGMRNFTELERQLSPEVSFQLMNSFLSVCEKQIGDFGGKVDKFIGDTAMCSFQEDEPPALVAKALQCASAINAGLEKLDANLPAAEKFRFGIGIACGEVISGAIGSKKNRLDYTLIGDPVNLASRLEKLAARAGRPAILAAVEPAFVVGEFEMVEEHIDSIKGKQKVVKVFSLREMKT